VPNELPFITWCRPETGHPLQRFVCYNLRIRCHGNVRQLHCNQTRCVGNVLTELLSGNGLLQLPGFLTHSLSCKRTSTPQQPYVSKPLPSNGRPLRLHHSGFHPPVTILLHSYVVTVRKPVHNFNVPCPSTQSRDRRLQTGFVLVIY
jgi:hypothetical protein